MTNVDNTLLSGRLLQRMPTDLPTIAKTYITAIGDDQGDGGRVRDDDHGAWVSEGRVATPEVPRDLYVEDNNHYAALPRGWFAMADGWQSEHGEVVFYDLETEFDANCPDVRIVMTFTHWTGDNPCAIVKVYEFDNARAARGFVRNRYEATKRHVLKLGITGPFDLDRFEANAARAGTVS